MLMRAIGWVIPIRSPFFMLEFWCAISVRTGDDGGIGF